MATGAVRVIHHLKKHYQVLPLVGCVNFALGIACYSMYWGFKKPDVGVRRWKYDVPWDAVGDHEQSKIFSPNVDYNSLPRRVKIEDVINLP
ncbi:Cytochrome c oxidase subunit NDUFA4 [Trichoplax sp. H2]|nr:Cytochrome c oxidase subunit NDUFA4 [Trichoplax sp. H2]|eukprot:RDD38314.1 Cytochrome c oxidase subunit NDUFA4 [Trichoplax sp. H2]